MGRPKKDTNDKKIKVSINLSQNAWPLNTLNQFILTFAGSSVNENSNKESFDYNIDSILHFLPDRSSDIVRMLFGVGCKQMMPEDVADMFDISAERVCQLKNQAIKKLSKKSNMIKRLVYD